MREPVAIVTSIILVITGIVSVQGFRDSRFLDRFLFSPAPILRDKEYYRLITSGFLHADWMHLLFNAYSFYAFGSQIELWFGYAALLTIYLGAILGGSLLSLLLHRHHDYRALGASGGVCGVIFADLFLQPGGSIMIFPLPVAIPSWLYAILFLVVSAVGIRHQLGNIGHDAHLGGAIIGLLITTALYPEIVSRNPLLYAAVMLISLGCFLWLWLKPLYLPAGNPGLRERLELRRIASRQARQIEDEEEMDRLLAKISRTGLDGLTPRERQWLDRMAEKKRGKGSQ